MRHSISTVWLVAVLVAGGSGASAAEVEERTDWSVDLGARELRVENTNGDIVVRGTDGGRTRIVATKRAVAGSRSGAHELLESLDVELSEEATAVVVVVRQNRDRGLLGWLSSGGGHAGVEFYLELPDRSSLALRTINGNMTLENLRGTTRANTTNGNLALRRIAGTTNVGTINGNVAVELVELEPDASLDVTSVNGNITVEAPSRARASLDARTVHGCVTVDMPIAVSGRSRSRITGAINGGGGSVRLRTTNGSIFLEEALAAPAPR